MMKQIRVKKSCIVAVMVILAFVGMFVITINNLLVDYSCLIKKELKKNCNVSDVIYIKEEHDFSKKAYVEILLKNGVVVVFDSMELINGSLRYRTILNYDGYIIYGYKLNKKDYSISLEVGYSLELGNNDFQTFSNNLEDFNQLFKKIQVIEGGYPNVFDEDFSAKLNNEVYFENDIYKIVFFKIKK